MEPALRTSEKRAGVRVLLTGATGFIGFHLAGLLVDKGVQLRCLVRQPRAAELPLGAELAEGDLRDPVAVDRAMVGVDRVFHCAADYRLYAADPQELYDSNVGGTENICRSALEAGVERLVYTSSVGALGREPDGRPATETTPVALEHMIGHYKRSKFLAEREAERWFRRGLDLVIVNPSTPLGEADRKPTPTGRIVVDFLRGEVPAYVDTGLNWIDVHDVAAGHWAAAECGRAGRNYILGHRNLSLLELYHLLAEISGRPAPRVRLPHWVPWLVGSVSTGWARLSGGEPAVALEAVRMARHSMYFDSARAVEELALPQSPIEGALRRAVEWFGAHGYLEERVR